MDGPFHQESAYAFTEIGRRKKHKCNKVCVKGEHLKREGLCLRMCLRSHVCFFTSHLPISLQLGHLHLTPGIASAQVPCCQVRWSSLCSHLMQPQQPSMLLTIHYCQKYFRPASLPIRMFSVSADYPLLDWPLNTGDLSWLLFIHSSELILSCGLKATFMLITSKY